MFVDSGIHSVDDTISATPWLERLVAAVPAARAAQDPEGVHRLRVALARLRVWLFLGGWQVLRDDLHGLRDQAAAVRDLDVQLAKDPPLALAADLAARRLVAHRELAQALAKPRLDEILRALQALPPLRRADAERRRKKLARAVLQRGRHAMAHAKKSAALHALRRAVRRLRFALEWMGDCPHALKELQDQLGLVEDSNVALRHLKKTTQNERGLDAYRTRVQEELRQSVRTARHIWRRIEPQLEQMVR